VRAAGEWPVFFGDQVVDPLAGIEAVFAIALHLHRPLIPAGGRRPQRWAGQQPAVRVRAP